MLKHKESLKIRSIKKEVAITVVDIGFFPKAKTPKDKIFQWKIWKEQNSQSYNKDKEEIEELFLEIK